MDRFFHPADLSRPALSLDEAESHHAARVLRKKEGDLIELFDGRGQAVRGQISLLKKNCVEVRVLDQLPLQPPAKPRITLAVAAPKGDRLKWLIEKATELGVDRVIPLLTERTVVESGASKLETLRAGVVAACKQSGRNWVMEITENQPLTAVCHPPYSESDLSTLTLIGEPASPVFHPAWITPEIANVQLVIGPEGGWSDAELNLLVAAGAIRTRVADHVLRTETAALQLAGLAVWWRESLRS